MNKPEDNSVMLRIKEGDEKSFDFLFHKYYPVLCLFAAKYLKDMDLSRSVVQQVFIDIWIKREKNSITGSVKSYLFQAVRNKSIDHLRKVKPTVEISEMKEKPDNDTFSDVMEIAELNNRINSAINQLPDKCREIFLLCRMNGLKYHEIAEKLDVSVKTVEMQMGIALKRLRKNIFGTQIVTLFYLMVRKKRIGITG